MPVNIHVKSVVERLLTKKSLRKLVRKSKNHYRCQGYSLNPKEAKRGVHHGKVVWKTRHPEMEKRPSAIEGKEYKGRGGTQLQHPSGTVINNRGISQQPSKYCELTMNRLD